MYGMYFDPRTGELYDARKIRAEEPEEELSLRDFIVIGVQHFKNTEREAVWSVEQNETPFDALDRFELFYEDSVGIVAIPWHEQVHVNDLDAADDKNKLAWHLVGLVSAYLERTGMGYMTENMIRKQIYDIGRLGRDGEKYSRAKAIREFFNSVPDVDDFLTNARKPIPERKRPPYKERGMLY